MKFRSILNFNKVTGEILVLDNAGLMVGRPCADLMQKGQLLGQFPGAAGFDEKLKKGMIRFGYFGNDANKFYPNTTRADLLPQPDDFVDIPFRLLSATVVGGGTWKATDFSNSAILRGSMSKLAEKPVYTDHDTTLENWVGIIKTVKWSDSFNSNGIIVPAGIDGILSIDAKTNPKVARGLLLGSIFSDSVTVLFDWEPSHSIGSDEGMWSFYETIGDIADDGKMVRRVVTEIHDYYETSLVWLGADPYAKLIDDNGNLRHIDTASIVTLSKEEKEKAIKGYQRDKKFKCDFALDKNVIYLSKQRLSEEEPKREDVMNKEILEHLRKILGLAADAEITLDHAKKLGLITSDEVVSQASAFSGLKEIEIIPATGEAIKFSGKPDDFKVTSNSHLLVEKARFAAMKDSATEVTRLTTELNAAKDNAELGKKYLKLKQDEVIRLYKLAVAKPDEAVIGLMSKANSVELDGLLDQYAKGATDKFGGCCKACGSTEFEFRSSLESGEEVKTPEVTMDAAALRDKFGGSSMVLGQKK